MRRTPCLCCQQIRTCLKSPSCRPCLCNDPQKSLYAGSCLIQVRQRGTSLCLACVMQYRREGGTHGRLGTLWGAGVGGNGGNGGQVEQQSDTNQVGSHDAGKTDCLCLPPALPANGIIAFAWWRNSRCSLGARAHFQLPSPACSKHNAGRKCQRRKRRGRRK